MLESFFILDDKNELDILAGSFSGPSDLSEKHDQFNEEIV